MAPLPQGADQANRRALRMVAQRLSTPRLPSRKRAIHRHLCRPLRRYRPVILSPAAVNHPRFFRCPIFPTPRFPNEGEHISQASRSSRLQKFEPAPPASARRGSLHAEVLGVPISRIRRAASGSTGLRRSSSFISITRCQARPSASRSARWPVSAGVDQRFAWLMVVSVELV